MHPDLEQAISFHESIVAEGSKALVGYDTAKALASALAEAGRGRQVLYWHTLSSAPLEPLLRGAPTEDELAPDVRALLVG